MPGTPREQQVRFCSAANKKEAVPFSSLSKNPPPFILAEKFPLFAGEGRSFVLWKSTCATSFPFCQFCQRVPSFLHPFPVLCIESAEPRSSELCCFAKVLKAQYSLYKCTWCLIVLSTSKEEPLPKKCLGGARRGDTHPALGWTTCTQDAFSKKKKQLEKQARA